MVTIDGTRKALQHIDTLPLYLYTYTSRLNMRLERVLSADLLDIVNENNLRGVKIHVLDGERLSLGNVNDKELSAFGDRARRLNLDIHIETSASDKAPIDEAVAIALKAGAPSARFYPRHEGNSRDVLSIVASDIVYAQETYQDSGLAFTIKWHEDLKGHELVSLVKESEMRPLSLLFDFVNMINASGRPIDILKTMASYITQVHIRDTLVVKGPSGLGHKACISGQGDVPFKTLLMHLIRLGDDEPQVTAYGLEEEVDYYASAFRFENESDNPWISYRQTSETPSPGNHLLDTRLRKEREDTADQINHVCSVLQQIKQEANYLLNHQ